jgi:HK97 family phage major capsid protein
MPSAQQLGDDLRKLRVDQDATFAKYKSAEGALDMPAEAVGEVRERNEAITKAAKAYEDQISLEGWDQDNSTALKSVQTRGKTRQADPADDREERKATKTLGELFVESPAYLNFIKAGKPSGSFDEMLTVDLEATYGKAAAAKGFKALFTVDTATGFAPQAIRLPDPVIGGYEVQSVASLMPEGRTSSIAVPYMLETTATNAATEVAAGASKPESALGLTEQTSAVRKIATHLPIVDEALEDVPMVESYIDTRLRTFVTLRENLQLLQGDGSAPNLRGILNTASVQTQAKGSDPTPDAVYKAMTKVRVNSFFEPTAGVFHPNDWQDVRLLRTTDGIYIWGSPADAGPERIWGINVLQTSQMLENTGLVGSFRAGAQIFRRTDVSVQIGWINDQFIKNQRTILAEERLALVVFRPAAFCMITGI